MGDPSQAHDAPVVISGWLLKRSAAARSGWKRRYFVLTTSSLRYYADEATMGEVRGEMALMSDATAEGVQLEDGLCYRIVSGPHAVVLRACPEGTFAAWGEALATVVRLARASRSAFPSTASAASTDAGSTPTAAARGSEATTVGYDDAGVVDAGLHTQRVGGTEFVVDRKYAVVKQVGSGGFGVVASAKDVVSGRKVAIKKIHNVFDSLEDAKRIVREVRIMRCLNHPNIVRLRDAVPPDETGTLNDVYLVLDLMPTDLHRVIHSKQTLGLDHQRFILYQLLCALDYLHSAGVLHRDVKPSNVLINEKCRIKLCDLGLARPIRSDGASTPMSHLGSAPSTPTSLPSPTSNGDELVAEYTEYVVTRWYRAPEVMLVSGQYDKEIDVWSAGCVICEIILKRPLFSGRHYLEQLKLITRTMGRPTEQDLAFVRKERARSFLLGQPESDGSRFDEKMAGVDPTLKELLRGMLCINPRRRVQVHDALRMPFFDECRDELFEKQPSGFLDLSDVEDLRVVREDIQRAMTKELLTVRYSALESARQGGARTPSWSGVTSSVVSTPHGAEAPPRGWHQPMELVAAAEAATGSADLPDDDEL